MHPLQKKGESDGKAIRREREWMQPVRDHADFVLDTSALSIAKLRSELLDLFGQQGDRGGLAVNILSFGFKHGIPHRGGSGVRRALHAQPLLCAGAEEQDRAGGAGAGATCSTSRDHPFRGAAEKMLPFLLPSVRRGGQDRSGHCHRLHRRPTPDRSVAVAHAVGDITETGYHGHENHRDITRRRVAYGAITEQSGMAAPNTAPAWPPSAAVHGLSTLLRGLKCYTKTTPPSSP